MPSHVGTLLITEDCDGLDNFKTLSQGRTFHRSNSIHKILLVDAFNKRVDAVLCCQWMTEALNLYYFCIFCWFSMPLKAHLALAMDCGLLDAQLWNKMRDYFASDLLVGFKPCLCKSLKRYPIH